MTPFKKTGLVALLAALLLSTTAAAKPVVIRVPAQARAQVNAAEVRPAQALDYGSFHWLEVDDADLARLAGVPYVVVPDARQVRVPGFGFDPVTEGEPEVAPHLRADARRPGFRLIQLAGPSQSAWLAEIAATGARVLQYYPHSTYLVWAGPSSSETASRLDFVRWQGLFHPAYKINADLKGRSGVIENVDVMFFDDGDPRATLAALSRLGAEVVQVFPSQPDKAFLDAIVRIDARALEAVAGLETVLWLGYQSPRPGLDDEMSSQIVAGNHPGGSPIIGYQSHLAGLGVDGAGVTWAVIDTGVDYNHPDLASHIVGGYSFPSIPFGCDDTGTTPGNDCLDGGHGTHVAGIIGGDATGLFADLNGFLYGLGVAPKYNIFAMNSISAGFIWPPAGGWQEHSKRAVLGGAIGGNNSWHSLEGTAHGYQASERTHDLMVRDGNFDTVAVAEPFIEVFSAGNSGPGAFTLTAPHEAKNMITVASSQNFRIGSIDGISSFSSRGPAVDGRVVPTIAAPGEQIASSRNDLGGSCSSPISGTNNLYAYCSGTSMAAPQVSGAVILLTDWWRGFNAGANPSPAMAKALLVNGAVDMGTPDIPNGNEGWGRINVTNVITPAAPAAYWDQTTTFAETGQELRLTLGVINPSLPVKVTLAWTDAAGAVGANPALVNNLDLTVVSGANTYYGNRFNAGWSATGGAPDALNNVENVFLQSPAGGIEVIVAATALNGDGVPLNGDATDQDFALVCSNCTLQPDFTLDLAPARVDVCAPANAAYTVTIGSLLGFAEPVTLSASGYPAGATVNFSTNPVIPAGTSTLTISNTGSSSGSYTVQVNAASSTGTKIRTAALGLYTAAPGVIDLQTPAHGAANQPVQPTFTWQAAGAGGTYTIEVASDPGFSSIVETASGLTATTYTLTGTLNTSGLYYWRVKASNACGVGGYSTVRSFSTVAAPGDCGVGTPASQLLATGFEAGAPGWTHSGLGDSWTLSNVRKHGGATSFHATNPSTFSDQSLVTPAVTLPAAATSLSLKFWNYQSIEDQSGGASCYDGGVLEISTDNGGSWTRIESQLLTDPYDGPVSTCCGNPVGGTNAWCGDPQDWTLSIVDLSGFAGQTVRLRFRLGTDDIISREGWYIDDVSLQACGSPIFNDSFENGDLSVWTSFLP